MYRTWAKCVARYRWQASLFKALVLAICSGVGAGLVRGARCFFWAARRSRFRLKISSLIILAQALFAPNTIAVEPLGGWRGTNVNQSLKAMQWLYY